jgi:hypothetical protein
MVAKQVPVTSQMRDELRSLIFAGKNKEQKSVNIQMFGNEVEIRQPTVGQISRLAKLQADEKTDALISIMLEYCYVPGTDQRLFDREDVESINSLPAGQWLADLNKAVLELTGLNVEVAEKN